MFETLILTLPTPSVWLMAMNMLIVITALVAFGITAPDFNSTAVADKGI